MRRLGDREIGRLGEEEGVVRTHSPIPPLSHSLTVAMLTLTVLLASCARQTETVPKDPLHVTVSLSTNVIRIGDVVDATITAYHPANGEVRLDDPGQGKDIVIRNRDWETEPVTEDRAKTVIRYELTSFRTGDHVLSTGLVECALSDGEVLQAPFPFALLQVESTLGDTNNVMRDIKAPVNWPAVFPPWLLALVIIVVLTLAVALVAARVLAKPRTLLQQPPPTPPHMVALQALAKLLRSGWIESENVEPFYVELSSIVRRYIEDRFDLRAPERTTEEFIREAAVSRVLTSDHQLLTREFLEQCDLVKFARHRPGKQDMQAAYDAAERLVQETRPSEVES